MGPITVKTVVGAMAGTVTAVIAVCFTVGNPPVDSKLLFAAMLVGAVLGSVIATSAGNRAIPMFWLYLVVVFAIIMLVPWWRYDKVDIHAYLPFGSIYVNSSDHPMLLFVLLLHILTSVVLAMVITLVHEALAARLATKIRHQGK